MQRPKTMSLLQSTSKTSQVRRGISQEKEQRWQSFLFYKIHCISLKQKLACKDSEGRAPYKCFYLFPLLTEVLCRKTTKTENTFLIDPPEVQHFLNVKTISFLGRSHCKEKSLISLIPVHKVKQKTTNLIPSVVLQKDTFQKYKPDSTDLHLCSVNELSSADEHSGYFTRAKLTCYRIVIL